MRQLTTPCIPWTGYVDPNGYGGKIKRGLVSRRPHIWAYIDRYGALPDGHEIDHLCHTLDLGCHAGPCPHRSCVNPEHLDAVTHAEQIRRKAGRQQWCRQGLHLRTPDNLYTNPRGQKECLACRNDRSIRSARERRASAPPKQGRGHQVHFNDDDIRTIRNSSDRQIDLARRYGVHENTINNIVNYRSYRHLD